MNFLIYEILINLIKNGLNKISIYLQPSNPSLSIMEGAVLFGIEPSIISIRKSKFTIGHDVYEIWNEKKHGGKGKKVYIEELKKYCCKDCFRKFIEINQNLKYKEEISHETFLFGGKGYLHVSFYKTKKLNPIFINEEEVYKIGELKLNIEIKKETNTKEHPKLKTIMKFGGTFIDVTSIDSKTGNSVKTTLAFD